MDRTRRHRGYVLCYDASEAKRGRVKKKNNYEIRYRGSFGCAKA